MNTRTLHAVGWTVLAALTLRGAYLLADINEHVKHWGTLAAIVVLALVVVLGSLAMMIAAVLDRHPAHTRPLRRPPAPSGTIGAQHTGTVR